MFAFVTAVPSIASRTSHTNNALNSHAKLFLGATFAAAPNRATTLRMNLESLQEKIQKEIQNAQDTSSKFGKTSKEAAVAWDTVEELEAEASHKKAKSKGKDVLDAYCEENPEADECRTYDT